MSSAGPDVVVIGAGLMGRWHAATAHRLGARVVAIVDPDDARATSLARVYQALALPNLEHLPRHDEPAVAHVCTPVADHPVACAKLLAAGYHVVCEKPIAGTAEEVGELLALAKSIGRQLVAVHQFTLQRGIQAAVARQGMLAPLRHVGFVFCTAGAAQGTNADRDDILLDVLPHPLSVLKLLFPGERLARLAWNVAHPAHGEMHAATVVNGVAASILVSCSARPTEASATIRGEGGTGHIDFYHGYASFSGAKVSRARKIAQPFQRPLGQMLAAGGNLARRLARWEPAYPGLRELVRRTYDSLDGTNPPPMDATDIVDIYEARDAISTVLRN